MATDALKGKVAIVTGGNSGIGKAVVLALAGAGANIVIDYVSNPDATEDLERQVEALGDQAIGVEADVSKVEDLQRLVDSAVKAFGRLDVMVNNAGVETRTSVLDTTEKEYEFVLGVNLKSAFFGTQVAAKQMIAQGGGGRIINMTSVHEDWPMPGNTAYCLSKGGMRMLTRTAGVELAPHGITVTGVGPGGRSPSGDPTLLAKLNAAIPIGRMAEPAEIGSVVAFLAGDGASYITATTIFADGGIMQSSPGSDPHAERTHGRVLLSTCSSPLSSAHIEGAANDRALRRHHHRDRREAERWLIRWRHRAKTSCCSSGDFLPREVDNWNPFDGASSGRGAADFMSPVSHTKV